MYDIWIGKDNLETLYFQIEIVGENEFYPKFSQPIFHFAVSEVSVIGGKVGQVEAVDADAGADAEVFYYLIGSRYGHYTQFGL